MRELNYSKAINVRQALIIEPRPVFPIFFKWFDDNIAPEIFEDRL